MSIEQAVGLIVLQGAITAAILLWHRKSKKKRRERKIYQDMADCRDRNAALNRQVDKNIRELQAIIDNPTVTSAVRNKAKGILMLIDLERGRIN